MDPYDCFCGPGSHIVYLLVNDHLCVILLFEMLESYEEDVVQADRLSDSAEVWVIIYYLISRQFYFRWGVSNIKIVILFCLTGWRPIRGWNRSVWRHGFRIILGFSGSLIRSTETESIWFPSLRLSVACYSVQTKVYSNRNNRQALMGWHDCDQSEAKTANNVSIVRFMWNKSLFLLT